MSMLPVTDKLVYIAGSTYYPSEHPWRNRKTQRNQHGKAPRSQHLCRAIQGVCSKRLTGGKLHYTFSCRWYRRSREGSYPGVSCPVRAKKNGENRCYWGGGDTIGWEGHMEPIYAPKWCKAPGGRYGPSRAQLFTTRDLLDG